MSEVDELQKCRKETAELLALSATHLAVVIKDLRTLLRRLDYDQSAIHDLTDREAMAVRIACRFAATCHMMGGWEVMLSEADNDGG